MNGHEARFDDVGNGFTLIARHQPNLTPKQQALAAAMGLHVVALDGIDDLDRVYVDHLDGLDAYAFISRADFVLIGTAASAAEVGGLLDQLRLALQIRTQRSIRNGSRWKERSDVSFASG